MPRPSLGPGQPWDQSHSAGVTGQGADAGGHKPSAGAGGGCHTDLGGENSAELDEGQGVKKAHWWEWRRRLEITALAWGLLIMNLTQNLLVAMFYHFFPTSLAFSALLEFWFFVVLCVCLLKLRK